MTNNMNGGQQTRICRKVTRELRAEFLLHDPEAGDRLEQEERMSAFLSAVIAAARKGLAKSQQLFSAAVTTRLNDGSTITVLTPNQSATLVELFAAAMSVPADTPAYEVAELLRKRGHLVSDGQIEEMKQRTDSGESTDMRTDGWGNWFPRQNGGSVSVGGVGRDGPRWSDNVYSLAHSGHWRSEIRVLLCNLDPRTLGL